MGNSLSPIRRRSTVQEKAIYYSGQYTLTMSTSTVRQMAQKLPFEIRDAVNAFGSDTQQAIVILLLNEDRMRFSDIRDRLSDDEQTLHQQTLTNALNGLQDGGLVNKRIAGMEGKQFKSYYEVSEYGERFVDCLLNSLGSVDNIYQRQHHYEPVENIYTSEGGPVTVEVPVSYSVEEYNETAPTSD
jgi:DNA-binding HxlR family transcriptional regulator